MLCEKASYDRLSRMWGCPNTRTGSSDQHFFSCSWTSSLADWPSLPTIFKGEASCKRKLSQKRDRTLVEKSMERRPNRKFFWCMQKNTNIAVEFYSRHHISLLRRQKSQIARNSGSIWSWFLKCGTTAPLWTLFALSWHFLRVFQNRLRNTIAAFLAAITMHAEKVCEQRKPSASSSRSTYISNRGEDLQFDWRGWRYKRSRLKILERFWMRNIFLWYMHVIHLQLIVSISSEDWNRMAQHFIRWKRRKKFTRVVVVMDVQTDF